MDLLTMKLIDLLTYSLQDSTSLNFFFPGWREHASRYCRKGCAFGGPCVPHFRHKLLVGL